ncbi:hypothetical protein ACF1AB_28130 [Streptomyces sp. NPDC014846]
MTTAPAETAIDARVLKGVDTLLDGYAQQKIRALRRVQSGTGN